MAQPHPALKFADVLKDLAEGRTAPEAWLSWWEAHSEAVEAAVPRGWFLKLKPKQLDDSGANRAALISQEGACSILEALDVPFVRSERYQQGWGRDFDDFCAAEQRSDGEKRVEGEFLERIAISFPGFAAKLGDGVPFKLEHVQPAASEDDLRKMERSLGVPLPESYKELLRCAREFWLLGGMVQFGFQHPFVHDFEPLAKLSPQQQSVVRQKGGRWPPPSQGMLCFAEFFMEADGDQVLFDVAGGLVRGEYPVLYYAHASRPPSVRRLADTFPEFLLGFLNYPAFADQDEDE